MCENSSNPMIRDNTITGNSANIRGGGIYCDNSSPTIENNAIRGNSAGDGGGIACWRYSSPVLSNNTLDSNTANIGGGVYASDNCHPALNFNRITNNDAMRLGGGVAFGYYSNPTLLNNTFSRNEADSGGAMVLDVSDPVVTNTIFWDDSAREGPEFCIVAGSPIITYCDIQDTLWPGVGNISCDPQFCYPDTGNYYLHENSCCVGTGQGGVDIGAFGVRCGEELTLTVVPGDTVVAHNDTLCYHVICENRTPDYQSLSFKVNVRLPNGNMYGPIFGPARFGMFGNGRSEGDMCHVVPPQAPLGDYWLFAEVYNLEVSARDSMAFTITGDGELANPGSPFGEWQTVLATLGGLNLIGEGVEAGLPAGFTLQSNYPNPFNASTVIRYQLPMTADVSLEVYNLLGRRVATLVDETQEAGYRSVIWDASEVSSGLYFYKLTAGDFTQTRRMMLVK